MGLVALGYLKVTLYCVCCRFLDRLLFCLGEESHIDSGADDGSTTIIG